MIKIVEIAVSMLIFISGVKIGDYYKPSMLEIHLSNGSISYIQVDKKSSYSCPINCEAIHYHDALVVNNNLSNSNYSISYLNNNLELKLNTNDIVRIFEVNEDKKNKKKKNKANFKKTKIDIKSFIKKYNL